MWKPIIKRGKNGQSEEIEQVKLSEYDCYCPSCDVDIVNGDNELTQFCPQCGTELIQPFFCLICHKPINASSKYCTNCGILAIRY